MKRLIKYCEQILCRVDALLLSMSNVSFESSKAGQVFSANRIIFFLLILFNCTVYL
jgi:hypothetical protein